MGITKENKEKGIYKSKLPFYSAFKMIHTNLRTSNKLCDEWLPLAAFFDDKYTEYAALRTEVKKVSVVVDGPVATSKTLVFKARHSDSRLANANIVGEDLRYNSEGVLHSKTIADEFSTAHSTVLRRIRTLKTGAFGDTSKATILSGTQRKVKCAVEVLTVEQYTFLKASYTLTSAKAVPTLVYLVQGGGLTKIGITGNIVKRFGSLSSSSPVVLSLHHQVHCANAAEIEKQLHVKYASDRRHGEWFHLSTLQIQEIKDYLDNL